MTDGEISNTMVGEAGSAGDIGGGAGSHKEAFLAGVAFAYKMGTEILGTYMQSIAQFDSRAGYRPQHTYTTTSSAGGAAGGPLERMIASYAQNNTGELSMNAYERTNDNKAIGYSEATYLGDIKPNVQSTYSSNAYGTITGPEGPENYMMKELYGR
ncbi:hypothetical protein GOV10_04695 [Candidatus Woesearchaeota archaeon]|nr:hypothetical protein [Candidatus Woesearchaeota archaeon]